MAGIERVFVVKKREFGTESEHLTEDLRAGLGLKGLAFALIVHCYDIQNLTREELRLCENVVFSEPPVDELYRESYPLPQGAFAFRVKYLPGQYDQRADSCMQCIQAVCGNFDAIVESSTLYVMTGEISDEDGAKIKKYLINSVDSEETPLEKPENIAIPHDEPPPIAVYDGFIDMSDEEIAALRGRLELAMSGADLLLCRDYFKKEGRNPGVTEIRVIDTYWSDHCRHTTFLTEINSVEIGEGRYKKRIASALAEYLAAREDVYGGKTAEKPVCLMDLATIGMKALRKQGLLQDLDESEEINACSIEIDVDIDGGASEKWLLMFKNETHNHPTEIEPFGGAATCLGGAIRDPLSGRAYVYQAMRVTGAGDPGTPVSETLAGKLPQRKITTAAAAGYSSYGNQIGLSTGLVSEIYHDGYMAKRMEIGAVVGAVKKENVVRSRPNEGDAVILVGGRTGRDGCGGATGSSKEHTEESIHKSGAEVQKGNAPTERKLQRLFRNPAAARLIKRCNDFGAGGVSVAIGELADGLVINLDSVPKKYEGLDGTELAISESQERMAVVVESGKAAEFIALASAENLESTVVAAVTAERRLKMLWRGDTIVDISRDFLDTNGARQTAHALVKTDFELREARDKPLDLRGCWLDRLKQLNVACQKGLSEMFCSSIGANAVLSPFGGKNQLTPAEVMAAKIPATGADTNTASLMSFGFNPDISEKSPFHGAFLAIVESAARIASAGGDISKIRLTLQEYFEKLGEDKERWGKPLAALLGAFSAQTALGVPAIGGKDSMSGSFRDLDVPPTLVSFAVCAADARDVISPELKKPGSALLLLKTPMDADGLPDAAKFKALCHALRGAILAKKVVSAHTVGFGGVCAALSKMSFGNDVGFSINYDEALMFSPQYGSFVVEAEPSAAELFEGGLIEALGETTESPDFLVNGIPISAKEAKAAWLGALEPVFPTGLLDETAEAAPLREWSGERYSSAIYKKSPIARPRVFIPVFPGTNCEYDLERRFALAGADCDTFVLKNLSQTALRESILEMSARISRAQIIMFPGGFSAGDEPEGSGKYIASVFRNESVRVAVSELLERRDGLILGICNGFQALIKLGLLPNGEISPITEDSPTLTFNKIGRHVSSLVNTRVVSSLSPWLANVAVGECRQIPVTHCEGRFVCGEETFSRLSANGQIAAVYADLSGKPSMDVRYNPNGSMFAVEAITSANGRILGKMGHSERIGGGLYKNVPVSGSYADIYGGMNQRLFEAGVAYFK